MCFRSRVSFFFLGHHHHQQRHHHRHPVIVIIIVTAHEGASVFARILEQAVVQAMYSMGWGADGHPYFLELGLVDDWPVIYQTQVLK